MLILRRRFPGHGEHKAGLLEFVGQYMKDNPESRKASENRGVFESDYGIIPKFYGQVPGIAALTDFFVESFADISSRANAGQWRARNLDPSRFSIQVTGSWFIHFLEGGHVAPHIHGNCSWSCVYYLRIGETEGPRNGGTFFDSPFGKNESDSDDWGSIYMAEASQSFRAEEGWALFFPSFLRHGSYPYKGPVSRVIFSANAKVVEQK